METPRQGFRDHLYVLLPIYAVLVVFCWMVTDGDFGLFDSENFGQFYDGQAASLLAGHWDVQLRSIAPEEFVYHGNAYGYFGFVPALPRMALNYFFPMMVGAWSRTSLTLGCAATLCCCYSLLLRARRWLGVWGPLARREKIAYGSFLILVGLGSTTIYLGSRAFIYHEAIIWAVALALAFFDQLLAYLMDGRLIRLAAMCLLAFLCFFCRISTGCGPLFALLLLCTNIVAWHMPDRWTRIATGRLGAFRRLAIWPKPPPLLHAAIAGATILTVIVTFVAINHAKFGTFFDVAPMRYYALMTAEPGREERTGSKWLRPGNIPTVLLAYTAIDAIIFQRSFPWINLQWRLHKLPGSHMDGAGGYSSILTAMPLFLIFAFASGRVLARHHRSIEGPPEPASRHIPSLSIVVIGLLAGLMPVLAFSAVENRYLHEFVPLLVVLSAFGVRSIFVIRRRAFKLAIPCLLIFLGLFQIYANCSFALQYQRNAVWGVPAKPSEQFRQWQQTIDRSLKSLVHAHDEAK